MINKENSSNLNNITLKDIADELQLSISTISRALKSHPRIGKKTQEKVKRTAVRLGYLSVDLLEEQQKKNSALIGVIVPKISYYLYAMAISGIEKIAEANGMHIIVCQSNESYEREKGLVEELSAIGVNGIIASLASETKNFNHFKKAKESGVPIVFFNRECNDVIANKVTINNERAAYEAVNHLISVGCKRIAYIGGPKILQINSDRAKGFSKAITDNKLENIPNYLIYSNFDKESVFSAARKLLYAPVHPDGILAFSDQIAIHVMLVAKERGISIPENLCIIGFNNEPVGELINPSLTSISQPGFRMGEEAAQFLINELKKPSILFEKRILNSFLVVRNSTNKNKI
ncbi:LacI family DNA-binding transcriptional regulator [Polaribacter septentrionalilitoris]|uniref:LacI family DNA-binding transcriptional regulator n=1 Tax=Polaribacter septentrionalilitoris TaxID=2494657 RepID=UPI001F378394|nr:LacI family DNA-binding transcriptional regulator [Polaribacter septentrionalilitoris]